MKSFNIIRYLKKWWPLIALMSFCAGVFFMRYATSNQAYTAQSIIKYNYSQAEDGKTPSGGELDVSEIFSSSVVKQAIENLDLTVNVDTIRSGGTVTPIVPDDVAKTQAAKIEKGEDVEEYQSTEYLVTLSLSSNYDTEYARTMLDEILSCYFASFGEKYVDYYTIPNNASALDGHGYDYLEQAEILKNTVSEISSNLINCQKSHPEFISSHTGMSLSDLLDDMDDTFGFAPDPLPEDVDDALEGAVKTVSYQPGEDVVLRNCMFKRSGYVFVGWNTEPDGTGRLYRVNGVPITDWAAGDTVDLYAQWKKPDHLKPVVDNEPFVPTDPDTPPEELDPGFGIDPDADPADEEGPADDADAVDDAPAVADEEAAAAPPEELDFGLGIDPDAAVGGPAPFVRW